MFLVGLLFAFAFALILTGLFYFILGLRGPWRGSWVFFIIIFLISFAAGEWIVPIGPMAWGYYWLPALTVAVLIAILLAAAAPPKKGNIKPPKSGQMTPPDVEKEFTPTYSPHIGEPSPLYSGDEPPEGVAIGALLWFFIILLLITAIIGVLY